MRTRIFIICVLTLFVLSNSLYSVELKPIKLPEVQKDGGKSLMQALSDRKSTREFSNEKLPLPRKPISCG